MAGPESVERLGAYGLQPTADGVADDGGADLAAHDEAEARRALVTGGIHVGHRVRCGTPVAPTDDGLVIRPAGESVRPRQHRSGSGRELGAPLGATSCEDAATGTGAHACTETVLLGTTTVVGLEGALAHGITSGSRCHRDAQTGDFGTGDCREGISQPIKTKWKGPITQTGTRGRALSPIPRKPWQ